MAGTQVKWRRGTTTEHATFTGAEGEITVDTTKDTVVVHDGTTAGGFPLAKATGDTIAFADGSASTPSITNDGDLNTGMFFPAADTVAVATGGAERVRVSSSGVALQGSTSGAVTLAVPAAAGTNTVTIAAQTGTLYAAGPAFSAYRNANQTPTINTETKVQLNAEDFDTNNNFDSTTNYRFTPTVAGYYQINFLINGNAATTFTKMYAAIYKNGSSLYFSNQPVATLTAGQNNAVSGSALVYMNGSTDYLELYVYLGGSGTATVFGDTTGRFTTFSGCLLRGA